MELQCLIIDDEPLAGHLLADYVVKAPGLHLAEVFTDPIKALHYLREHTVDVLLLDVQMPELNGLQVARIVGDQCQVILTTAYDQYALDGYTLNVVDYLLKPISFERFLVATEKLMAPSTSAAPAAAPTAPKFIFVKSGHRTHRIDLATLRYASAGGDYLTLYLTAGKKLLTLESIGDLVDRLPQNRFCRIHRSHLVALDKIDFVERRRVVIDGEYLPISEGFAGDFWDKIHPQPPTK
ncbi:MAG: LytTR family DNA-binding domain-containing protein [Bacteroidota bacterium]